MVIESAPDVTPERAAFYQKIDTQNLSALWNVFNDIITMEPRSDVQAHLWRYASLRESLLEAGPLITAKEAERRVLILENPGMRGQSRITNTLYAGLQLVIPGEVAPAHRHTQSALRFIVEGQGAHTAVNGERTYMQVGDFIITAQWYWHDHGNETEEPVIWLDGLDVPMVQFFDASFAEGWPEDEHPIERPPGDSIARYGQSMLPVDYDRRPINSPVFSYPYERTRETLEVMRRDTEWDECHGLKIRFINPVTGGHAMPTMATFMQLLPKGFSSAPYRSTDATVFSVVAGRGRTTVGDSVLDWEPKDIFVVPSWAWVTHETDEDAVLFSYSDRPVQQLIGLLREERGSA